MKHFEGFIIEIGLWHFSIKMKYANNPICVEYVRLLGF